MDSISPQDQNSQTAKAQEKRDGALAFWHSDLLEANLSVYDRAVYTDLAMRYNFKKHKAVFPSIRKIAGACRVSLTTVIRSVKELEKLGLIEVKRTFGKSSQYQLCSSKQWREWKRRKEDQEQRATVPPQTPVSHMEQLKTGKTVPPQTPHCSATDTGPFHHVESILILVYCLLNRFRK
jgi:hypothetical protein